jgi:phage head morphogenesis protein, SPP1 gp7 family
MEKMKSKEYWQKRYMLIEGLNNTQGINVKADIDKAFRMAENGIQSEIEKWYSRIADNNGVSISKARQMLTNRELEEFKWDLADYIKHGEENNINGKWIKELENASGRWHINRLEALKLRVQQKAEEAFGNEVDSIDNFARDAYMRGYYRTAYEIQKGLGLGWNVGVLDDSAIDEIIKKPWCPDGKNFSSRIWTRKAQMVDELHRELLRTTLLGEHPTKAIDRMLKYVDNSFGNARHAAGRLAMTEAAYFGSKGQQDSFNMLGVEEYEIVATLDNSTSKICREMDGKHFPMSEYKAGVTAPPFHPYCRTCTCPYFDDEFTEKDIKSARNEEGEVYHVPADMKYEEWKKKYVKENNLKDAKKSDKLELSEAAQIIKDDCEANNVEYREVQKLKEKLSSAEIIKKIAGGDMTKGSCSSLALAYIGNRNGLDVVDFRGGESQYIFSLYYKKILELPGVEGSIMMVKQQISGTIGVLDNLILNKEYYIATGKHAAIVRRLESGLEYLELQSKKQNGWMPFDKYGSIAATLNKRFGCRKTVDKAFGRIFEKPVVVMDVESFSGNKEFEQLLGYINTALDSQMKGALGDVK